jgi:CRP/FNR family cyclic AMP-dependent transcriptional regulator
MASEQWNLASLALFADLSTAEIDDMARLVTIIDYPAGHTIFSEDEPGDALYALLRGRVDMSCRDHRGHEQTLATLEAGAILGEIALLTGEPRLATARTVTDTTALRLTNETFKALLKQGHAAAQKILYNLARNVASHLGEMNRRLLRLMADQHLATLAPHEGELDELKRKLFVEWKF